MNIIPLCIPYDGKDAGEFQIDRIRNIVGMCGGSIYDENFVSPPYRTVYNWFTMPYTGTTPIHAIEMDLSLSVPTGSDNSPASISVCAYLTF